MTNPMKRRDVLRAAGLVGLGAVLAGCTDGAKTSPIASASRSADLPSSAARSTYDQLARQLSGSLVLPGQAGFRPKALLYNPRFRSHAEPSAIAQVVSAADVAACVKFAAAGGAPLRVRNGGHSYGGWSSGPGLVIDLAKLNAVKVNTAAKTATVGAGALLADVYSALGAKGVSIGAGSCATVGVTGLTLGGGVGVLARSYGLTCDQLASVQVVTADGRIRTSGVSRSLEPAYRQPFSATSSILQRPLPSAGVHAIVEAVGKGSSIAGMVEGGVSFDAFGGAIADVAADAAAFPWRTALADIQYTATWPYAKAGSSPAPFDDFVQAERRALRPWVGDSAYVNYADPKLADFATAYWGPNLTRVSQVTKTYDPHNVFSFPQSVAL